MMIMIRMRLINFPLFSYHFKVFISFLYVQNFFSAAFVEKKIHLIIFF